MSKECAVQASVFIVGCEHLLVLRQALASVQNIADECGFKDIILRTWSGMVDAIVPGTNFHVHWDGLWSDEASDTSLQMLVVGDGEEAEVEYGMILEFLQTKLNKTEVTIKLSSVSMAAQQFHKHITVLYLDLRWRENWMQCVAFSAK